MAEPENHTLTLLREMRADIARMNDQLNGRLDRMEKRLDAMHLNGVKALKGFIGHRSMVERTIASFEVDLGEVTRRVDALEAARP